MLSGDQGEVWLGDYPWPEPAYLDSRGPKREWLVFGPDGEALYRVETPEGFRVNAIRDSKVFGIHVDENGVESIHVYALKDD
jgi:hypothetical protein